jgi:hypothetical protein
MDTIPVELLDEILRHLGEWDFPVTARYLALTPSSRQSILNARLVRHCFRDSKILAALFLTFLEEMPFTSGNDRLPRLTDISA